MRTRYRIDDFQQTYFVIDDFDTLFRLVDRDLAAVYHSLAGQEDLPADAVLPTDKVYARGDGSHHAPSRAA
jgi:phenylalanine-4-hydroxylase